jgi:hypothetical protein
MQINMNKLFEGELTAAGARVYNEHYKEFPDEVRPSTVSAGDKIELELWYMMGVFGPHLSHGGDVAFVSNAVTYRKGAEVVQAHIDRANSLMETEAKLRAQLARAERALVRAGFEDRGGEEWAPPIGQLPGFVPVDGWLIDGSLVYKLDETGSFNTFEINVTQADGKRRQDGPRVALAQKIRAMLAGGQALYEGYGIYHAGRGKFLQHRDGFPAFYSKENAAVDAKMDPGFEVRPLLVIAGEVAA